jgi:hypothetical protein
LAEVAVSKSNDFNLQNIDNLLWAYATVGKIDQHLFTSFTPIIKLSLSQSNCQNVALVAWAYAIANVNAPSLFNADFVAAFKQKRTILVRRISLSFISGSCGKSSSNLILDCLQHSVKNVIMH